MEYLISISYLQVRISLCTWSMTERVIPDLPLFSSKFRITGSSGKCSPVPSFEGTLVLLTKETQRMIMALSPCGCRGTKRKKLKYKFFRRPHSSLQPAPFLPPIYQSDSFDGVIITPSVRRAPSIRHPSYHPTTLKTEKDWRIFATSRVLP